MSSGKNMGTELKENSENEIHVTYVDEIDVDDNAYKRWVETKIYSGSKYVGEHHNELE